MIRTVLLALMVGRVEWVEESDGRMVAWTQITSPQGSKKGPMSEMVQKNWHGFGRYREGNVRSYIKTRQNHLLNMLSGWSQWL